MMGYLEPRSQYQRHLCLLSSFQQAVGAERQEGDPDALVLPVKMTEVPPNAGYNLSIRLSL